MDNLKRLVLFSFTAVMASCVSVDHTAPPVIQQDGSVQENLGEQVARHLTTRYNDTRANCDTPSQPSFLCNGVMIRGTASNPTYHVWENSKESKEKGGVSFAYLRSDTDFRNLPLNYTNGFIFKSYKHAEGKFRPEVLCSFPVDAWTAYRPSDGGCGEYPGYAGSGLCHLNGVTTAAQWWSRYNSHPSSRYAYQCGFDVRDARNELAGPAFAASVEARRNYLGAEGYGLNNELIIKAWADNLGGTLPLEAFFYVYGTGGLTDARRNQTDLKNINGIVIPIISVRFAPTQTGVATFYYIASDQAETMPPAEP
ncbi:hypothetical protein BWR59_02085 [Pseudomonas sp. Bc-h]|jgi:hypothetical protein|uniref:hypothetical protein n=1 Tax=Pseudomonas sp. Bc-h TaxID=1943632 RepID=UPI0009DA1850|nr:hypothetical protein [Pseudomonas sp. Bc-h]OQR37906.1 hypothetical protein BWR59_02085 [Pseudomonas sp. Bc-h]